MQRPFHPSLSVAHSSPMFQSFLVPLDSIFPPQLWSSSRALPLHLVSTTARMFAVSSLLLTCPNHSSLLRLITVAIGSTFASSKISSFLRCSNRLTPIAHRTNLISVVAIHFSSLTDSREWSLYKLQVLFIFCLGGADACGDGERRTRAKLLQPRL